MARCDSPILPSPTMPNRTIVVLRRSSQRSSTAAEDRVLNHRVGLPALVEQGPVADLRKALSNASNPGVAFAGRARAGDVVDEPTGGEQVAQTDRARAP